VRVSFTEGMNYTGLAESRFYSSLQKNMHNLKLLFVINNIHFILIRLQTIYFQYTITKDSNKTFILFQTADCRRKRSRETSCISTDDITAGRSHDKKCVSWGWSSRKWKTFLGTTTRTSVNCSSSSGISTFSQSNLSRSQIPANYLLIPKHQDVSSF